MGILNNDTQTVDAVLTKVGKRRLAEGHGLNIQAFGLSDDFASYFLWNANHPSGSTKYGEAIEGLPLPEAVTNAGNALRYSLTTRDRNILFNPVINVPGITTDSNTIRIEGHGSEHNFTLKPSLINGPSGGNNFTFKVADTTGLNFSGASKINKSPSTIDFPRAVGVLKPAEFHGSHLVIGAEPTETAFETLITVTEDNTSATEIDVRVLIDANIYQKPSDKLKV